ncbi:hypothetical protein [Streptodolium elevatio]|uniref:Uncharacterized protein n=1 Tax=Streptodolium elevatio TaxID=3157996 RepID=A0ABV3D9X8_9ACTN
MSGRGPELRWRTFLMPFTDTPVRLARLRRDSVTTATAALVRFPPGWSRTACVAYASDEEFMLLSGELRMSGQVHRPGVRVRVPGGTPRRASSTPRGAVAVAWFTGDPGVVERLCRARET